MSNPIASGSYQAPAGWVGELCTYARGLPGANPHIAAITYNRPDSANAINLEMREDINASWATFRDDQEAWVGVLRSTGRIFSAGADLKGGSAAGEWPGTYHEVPTMNSFESGWEIFKPTVASVQGACIGYGCTAASTCDFIVASEDATFSFPEVKIGVPTIVGSIRLPPKIGWTNAMELLLLGESFTAQRAFEMGLVWKVVPAADLEAETLALAERLCANAPVAQRVIKEIGWRSMMGQMGWTEAVRFGETMRRAYALTTDDAKEGGAAFKEKREPVWTGKSRL